jgi:hypothetical protein
MRSIARWTERDGEVTVASFPVRAISERTIQPSAAPAIVATPIGTAQAIAAAYVDNHQLSTSGIENAAPPLSWASDAGSCNGMRTVYAPNLCPDDETTGPAGEHLVTPALVRGARAEPWVIALLTDATRTCRWRDVTGCIESKTCECAQFGSLTYGALTLQIQSLVVPARTVRIPLSGVLGGRLAVAEREDGAIIAAVGWSDGKSGHERLHVRYFGIDTR